MRDPFDLHFLGPATFIRAVLSTVRERRAGVIVSLLGKGAAYFSDSNPVFSEKRCAAI